MSESQSRYAIMQELNDKKLKAKDSLAKLEKELDEYNYKIEREIELISRAIEDKESNYKREHEDWKKEQEVRLKLLEKEYSLRINSLKAGVIERDENYESDFLKWKQSEESAAEVKREILNRFKALKQADIETTKEAIKTIEESVNHLKDMSKEQS